MKITANKNVNRRTGPGNNWPANGFVKTGDVVEIDNAEAGTMIDGNGIWYHAVDNCWYWSGAFSVTDFTLVGANFSALPDKNKIALIQAIISHFGGTYASQVKGFKGTAAGSKNNDPAQGIAFVVYVEKKIPEGELTTVMEKQVSFCGFTVPVDIREVGNPSVHASNSYIDTVVPPPPLQLGGTIGQQNSPNFGTRSLVVTKGESATKYVMTCFHVACESGLKFKQDDGTFQYPNPNYDQIFAALPANNVPGNANSIGSDILKVSEGILNGIVDYSLIQFPPFNTISNNILGDIGPVKGFYTQDEIPALYNQPIKTFGAASNNVRTGVINNLAVSPWLNIAISNKEVIAFQYLNVLATDSCISSPGDSGAPVVDSANKLVGFIVGGNSVDISYIMPFYVLNSSYFINLT